MKNFAVFAALVFSGFLFFDPVDGWPYIARVTLAFLAFCALASSVYLMNDIWDKNADQHHPFKSKRPIASGALSVRLAMLASLAFGALAFLLAVALGWFFCSLLVVYVLMQVAYSKRLKHIPIIDVSIIASGFLIRVYAGAVVVNLHMNVWFLLTVISASLFLAVGKRQSERTLLSGLSLSDLGSTRKILTRYSDRLLDQFTAMFATATWLTYALFTFQSPVDENKPGLVVTFYTLLPKTLHSQKLLMLSLPFVIFGIMRYLQLVYEQNKGESPERVWLSDRPLLITVFLFTATVLLVIYAL